MGAIDNDKHPTVSETSQHFLAHKPGLPYLCNSSDSRDQSSVLQCLAGGG